MASSQITKKKKRTEPCDYIMPPPFVFFSFPPAFSGFHNYPSGVNFPSFFGLVSIMSPAAFSLLCVYTFYVFLYFLFLPPPSTIWPFLFWPSDEFFLTRVNNNRHTNTHTKKVEAEKEEEEKDILKCLMCC